MLLQIVSGACDIPVTRFLGESPKGLNSTGESDLRNYYDMVAGYQNNTIKPLVSTAVMAALHSEIGAFDESELEIIFLPLWQPSDKDQAEVAAKMAEAYERWLLSGVVPAEVLAETAKATMIESDAYPGAEQAFESYEAGLLEPIETNEPETNPDDTPPADGDA